MRSSRLKSLGGVEEDVGDHVAVGEEQGEAGEGGVVELKVEAALGLGVGDQIKLVEEDGLEAEAKVLQEEVVEELPVEEAV